MIRTIHAGRRRFPPEIAAGIVEHVADDALADREIELLRRVARGTSKKVIASDLSIWSNSHKRLRRRSCICRPVTSAGLAAGGCDGSPKSQDNHQGPCTE